MKPKLRINKSGSFRVENVDKLSYLYFPLTNFHSLKSSITPSLNGDSKIDQNSFALLPISSEDMHNSFMNRNVYFKVNNDFVWSVTGNTPYQMLHKDKTSLEADFLVHDIKRENKLFVCNVESFVPMNDTFHEWHKVVLKNTTNKEITLKPVISIPLYSRSADNLRDHRHVTSLLNQVTVSENTISNRPTFSFDERGHILNDKTYFAKIGNQSKVVNYWPKLQEFIGEGNTLLNPQAVIEDDINNYGLGDIVSGFEALAGFELDTITLKAGESFKTVFIIGIEEKTEMYKHVDVTIEAFDKLKDLTKKRWDKELSSLQFDLSDKTLNGWLKWVTLQPILRRIYGCSFLPHHDYGRGGRGWRDLWQDLLALILMEPSHVRNLLLNNFLGVRIDGSNATIIGDKPGEFLADRNNIARVWMDHGSWPLLTTLLYVNKTGDYQILFENQKYFKDKFSHYTKKVNSKYNSEETYLKNMFKEEYQGTILEHLIIQNVVPFYNVGKHMNIRLEGADWNDGLDMAEEAGESVAFTSLYANNLIELSNLLLGLDGMGIFEIEILEELKVLLMEIDYSSYDKRHKLLKEYFDLVESNVSGNKNSYNCKELSLKLKKMGQYLQEHIRMNEWLKGEDHSWFNGYYDGDGFRLEDTKLKHMTLTGQVFPIFSHTATQNQIEEIIKSANEYLYDELVGGYKLNTNFNEIKLNMGRLFGFAYGHKENGAMFSHMAVMYANALYKRGYAKAGHKVLMSIFNHCKDINKSKIYPGIPEYIDSDGRGMYHYLTGSASWFILTEVTEVFGVKGDFGKLLLEPKLLKEQFDEAGLARIKTIVSGHLVEIIYVNRKKLDYKEYQISEVINNGVVANIELLGMAAKVLSPINSGTVEVILK